MIKKRQNGRKKDCYTYIQPLFNPIDKISFNIYFNVIEVLQILCMVV